MRSSSDLWKSRNTGMRGEGRATRANREAPGAACESHEVAFGKRRIAFLLKRTGRRTLGITVRPDASVLVTAPSSAAVDRVRSRVKARAPWIVRQQEYFYGFRPPIPPRRYVSGETHRFLGRQYRLKVVEGPGGHARLKGKFIVVETLHKDDRGNVRQIVESWYLVRARERFKRSVHESLARFHGRLKSPVVRLKRMPKRWGSWTKSGAIYLNPELVLAPGSCIDYVVTHELCHLVHARHGREFYALLLRVMPDWEERKARLERMSAETGSLGGREWCVAARTRAADRIWRVRKGAVLYVGANSSGRK